MEFIRNNLPGDQAINKLYKNDLENSGKADRGIFNKIEIDDIYNKIGNRSYSRDIPVGNSLDDYTGWVSIGDYSGYSIWKYSLSDYSDNENNELYINNKKLKYMGVSDSETTPIGFTNVFIGDNKKVGESFINVTTEASSIGGASFYFSDSLSHSQIVTPTLSGVSLDYRNILNGTVSVTSTSSMSGYVFYVENDDYSIDYSVGTISLLSGTLITGNVEITYNIGTSTYIGLMGSEFNVINIGTTSRGMGNVYSYDYYSGAEWSRFIPETDTTSNLSNNGNITIGDLPSWTETSINGETLYWIRVNLSTVGITLPTIYYILQSTTSVETLLSLTVKDINEYYYKWCYYDEYIYVTIPNNGASNQEGIEYIKSTSSTDYIKNFFVYNNEYLINYRNQVEDTGIVLTSLASAPTAIAGTIYFNSSNNHFYGYDGSQWKQLDN